MGETNLSAQTTLTDTIVDESPVADGDTSTATFTDNVEEKPKQSRETNAEYARKRRETETLAKIEAAKNEAIIDALGGINPYTNEKMTDANDIAEWRTMKKIADNGGDPISDYHKQVKETKRAEDMKAENESKQAQWFANDKDAFVKAYPDANLEELINDKLFQRFTDGKVGTVPLAELYESYMEVLKEADDRATRKAAQKVANAKASPGSLNTGAAEQNQFFTKEQVKSMSRQEVHDNYEKIRESMKKWNSN